MRGVLDIPDSLAPVQGVLESSLARVEERFDRALVSSVEPVGALTAYLEKYRGKMLRPCAAVLSAMAGVGDDSDVGDDVITIGAVVEMIHMATLVHDDVLDEAETRRNQPTVANLRGNEAAVILGDYLFAASYRLCSSLDDQSVALEVAQVSMDICAGELLQNHHRDDLSLDEPTYFEIVRRKTGDLIALACRLGSRLGGATSERSDALSTFGMSLGTAFQIQDDVLDLLGDEDVVGKSVGRDLAKGKMTLPLIRFLAQEGGARARVAQAAKGDESAAREIVGLVSESGAVDSARRTASELVDEALASLGRLPESGAREYLRTMAGAVIDRSF